MKIALYILRRTCCVVAMDDPFRRATACRDLDPDSRKLSIKVQDLMFPRVQTQCLITNQRQPSEIVDTLGAEPWREGYYYKRGFANGDFVYKTGINARKGSDLAMWFSLSLSLSLSLSRSSPFSFFSLLLSVFFSSQVTRTAELLRRDESRTSYLPLWTRSDLLFWNKLRAS